jgi:hypothetical protein
VRGAQQLEPDQHRVQPADEDEHADPDQVLHPDDLVVGAQTEVASRPRRLLLPKRRRLAEQALDRVAREAEADEEAEDARHVREEERDVVLARVGEVGDAGPLEEMAEPPADVEPDDAEHDRRQQVESGEPAEPHPARTWGSGEYVTEYGGRYFCTGVNCLRWPAIHAVNSASSTTRPVSNM